MLHGHFIQEELFANVPSLRSAACSISWQCFDIGDLLYWYQHIDPVASHVLLVFEVQFCHIKARRLTYRGMCSLGKPISSGAFSKPTVPIIKISVEIRVATRRRRLHTSLREARDVHARSHGAHEDKTQSRWFRSHHRIVIWKQWKRLHKINAVEGEIRKGRDRGRKCHHSHCTDWHMLGWCSHPMCTRMSSCMRRR